MARVHSVLTLSALLVGLMATGCGDSGPPLGRVTGTVTIDGQPASGVTVNYQSADGGRGSSAVTDENGQYDLIYSPTRTGALVGTHNVSISGGEPGIDDTGGGSETLTQSSNIPQEYTEIKKTVEVESGNNTHDLSFP